jgi:hypothetical protein
VRRYVPPRLGAPRIERELIPSGFAGTRRTAAHVGRLIREGSADFYVRQKAIDILFARRIPPKDYIGEIEALFRWVQRNVRYTKDPFRVEVLHSARRMLELRAGDCDDMTIVLGALVKSVGHAVRIVLSGPDPRRPDLFSHIYLEAQHRGEWIPLDATMPYGMGWSPRAPVCLVLSIEEPSNHDHVNDHAVRITATAQPLATSSPRPRTRVAPHPAAGHSHSRRAAPRSSGEGAVGALAPPATFDARSVASDDLAPRVGERPRAASPAAHDPTDLGALTGLGSAESPTAAAAGAGGRSGSPDAEARAGHAPTRRHGAAAPILAARTTDGSAPERSLNAALEDASKLYCRFTRSSARSLSRVSHRRLIPPVLVELGRLMAVVYRSDKWVGRPRTYIHYMKDPPRLAADVEGRRLFVVGGSYRITEKGIEG